MMADGKRVLKKLTTLKRQKAEQHFQALQLDMNKLETRIRDMSARLAALNDAELSDDLRLLAQQHGHTELLIEEITEQTYLISDKKTELDLAREGLRRAIYSQDQV